MLYTWRVCLWRVSPASAICARGGFPQVLTFGGAIAGLVFQIVNGGWTAGAISLAGWAVAIAMFLLPFALGGLGAGDVKLLGALGAWLGPSDAMWLGIYTGVAGGVIAHRVVAGERLPCRRPIETSICC